MKLSRTVFVTLLMIGMAMTGCGKSKPKISIPAGQFDAATFKGPWPTKKVDCIDLGNNYFNVHYQDGTELHFADSRPNRYVPPIPDPLPADVDNADLCSGLHADKAAKPPAKKAVIVTACAGCITVSPPLPDPPPTEVPAIRKTHKRHDDPVWTAECLWALQSGLDSLISKCEELVPYWDCADRDAYSLQVSVSGKRANCHRIVP